MLLIYLSITCSSLLNINKKILFHFIKQELNFVNIDFTAILVNYFHITHVTFLLLLSGYNTNRNYMHIELTNLPKYKHKLQSIIT